MQSLRLRTLAFVAGVAIAACSGWASADPPSRVARLGYTTGAVSFSPAGENDWVQATINRPLTTGDRLWADAGARAEIQVGGAMIRMNAGTGRIGAQSRRSDRPAAVDAGHVERPRAAARAQPGVRGRHAESRLHAAATRRIPDHGGSRRQCDRHRRAQGQGEVYGEGASYVDRLAAAVSLHGDRLARVPVCRRAGPRRIRSLGDRSRPQLRQLGLRPLCVAGRHRLSGPRCQRHLARRRSLRQRLDPESRGRRLGAVPRRTLGMGRPVGLDVGG